MDLLVCFCTVNSNCAQLGGCRLPPRSPFGVNHVKKPSFAVARVKATADMHLS